MPEENVKLTGKQLALLAKLFKGSSHTAIGNAEGVTSTTIGNRFAKMKPLLDQKTLMQIESARKTRQTQLTEQDRRILQMAISGKSAREIAEKEGMRSRYSVRNRIRIIKRQLDPKTAKALYPRLTKKHGDIIRLRLAGHNYVEIARKLKYNHNQTVRAKLKATVPLLHPRTVERLQIGTRVTPASVKTRQKIVGEFLKQLSRFPHGKGAIAATSRAFDKHRHVVTHYLRKAGINPTSEIQRRRLEFALKVAETMHLPVPEVKRRLGVATQETITRYRKMVQRGEHLHGALELVEKPEAQQWWDLKMPEIREEISGLARINLTVRNETVAKDLELFRTAIEATKKEAVKWHDDKLENRGNEQARENFKKAVKTRDALRKGLARYKEREKAFRTKYKLPVHESLIK